MTDFFRTSHPPARVLTTDLVPERIADVISFDPSSYDPMPGYDDFFVTTTGVQLTVYRDWKYVMSCKVHRAEILTNRVGRNLVILWKPEGEDIRGYLLLGVEHWQVEVRFTAAPGLQPRDISFSFVDRKELT